MSTHGSLLGFEQASPNVQWMVIRNTSSFLRKRKLGTFTVVRHCRAFTSLLSSVAFFQEPNNLKNRNTFRSNGLVHPKVVGVEAVAGGKGVVFSTASAKSESTGVPPSSDLFVTPTISFRHEETR